MATALDRPAYNQSKPFNPRSLTIKTGTPGGDEEPVVASAPSAPVATAAPTGLQTGTLDQGAYNRRSIVPGASQPPPSPVASSGPSPATGNAASAGTGKDSGWLDKSISAAGTGAALTKQYLTANQPAIDAEAKLVDEKARKKAGIASADWGASKRNNDPWSNGTFKSAGERSAGMVAQQANTQQMQRSAVRSAIAGKKVAAGEARVAGIQGVEDKFAGGAAGTINYATAPRTSPGVLASLPRVKPQAVRRMAMR